MAKNKVEWSFISILVFVVFLCVGLIWLACSETEKTQKRKQEAVQAAYDSGYSAASYGLPVTLNPYPPDGHPFEFFEWQSGYAEYLKSNQVEKSIDGR